MLEKPGVIWTSAPMDQPADATSSSALSRLLILNARALAVGWSVLLVLILLGTQVPSLMWAFGNPTPHHWDEADYLNVAWQDFYAYQGGGIAGIWHSLMHLDPYRPPGFRLAGSPFLFLGMPLLPTLRALSIGCFTLTLWLMYRTGTKAIDGDAGRAAGAVTAIAVALCVVIGWSTRIYGTEFTLYLSISLVLYCLTQAAHEPKYHSTWIGLGIALGLGILSKLSFAFLGGPAALAALVLVWLGVLPGISTLRLIGACAIAAALSVYPYYYSNWSHAFYYAHEMTGFARHSLHKSGFALVKSWVQLQATEGLGWRVGVMMLALVLAIVGVIVVKRFSKTHHRPVDRPRLNRASAIVVMSLAMGLPLPIFQLVYSLNDNVRHVSPSYLPLALAIGVAAGASGLLSSGWSWVTLFVVAFFSLGQVGEQGLPLSNWTQDVWDWEPLYQACQDHHLRTARIAHLGSGSYFNDPCLIYPWRRRNAEASSDWIWRSDLSGPFDWNEVMKKLDQYDVIVTTPHASVPESKSMLAEPNTADNSHNDELAERLMHDPRFAAPIKFAIGKINQNQAWVFLKASHQ